MKKQHPRKLTLSRETVRSLTEPQLAGIVGGELDPVPKTWTKRKGTCTSCDGPVSCADPCITTQPITV